MTPPAAHPICADCGYDLAGVDLVADWRCPECGGVAYLEAPITPKQVVHDWITECAPHWKIAIGLALVYVALDVAMMLTSTSATFGVLALGTIAMLLLYLITLFPYRVFRASLAVSSLVPDGLAPDVPPLLRAALLTGAAYIVGVGGVGVILVPWMWLFGTESL